MVFPFLSRNRSGKVFEDAALGGSSDQMEQCQPADGNDRRRCNGGNKTSTDGTTSAL
jgi:hypothetical protein